MAKGPYHFHSKKRDKDASEFQVLLGTSKPKAPRGTPKLQAPPGAAGRPNPRSPQSRSCRPPTPARAAVSRFWKCPGFFLFRAFPFPALPAQLPAFPTPTDQLLPRLSQIRPPLRPLRPLRCPIGSGPVPQPYGQFSFPLLGPAEVPEPPAAQPALPTSRAAVRPAHSHPVRRNGPLV
jgi:hypothetical protein